MRPPAATAPFPNVSSVVGRLALPKNVIASPFDALAARVIGAPLPPLPAVFSDDSPPRANTPVRDIVFADMVMGPAAPPAPPNESPPSALAKADVPDAIVPTLTLPFGAVSVRAAPRPPADPSTVVDSPPRLKTPRSS